MIRIAHLSDLPALQIIDQSLGIDREEMLLKAISDRSCHVYQNEAIHGYLIFAHSLFGHGFISLCVVDKKYQGKGIGTALFEHAVSLCRTEKLFSSTNESNQRMRKLFLKMGFQESGKVLNLDPGDPEILYWKPIPLR